MAINTGVNATKVNVYAVLDLTTGLNVTKVVVYAVLDTPAPSGGPFPHFTRRNMSGGMVPQSGGLS